MRADQLHDLLADARSHEAPADPTAGRSGVARVERRRRVQHAGVVAAILLIAVAVFVRSFPLGGGGEDGVDTVDDPTEVPRLVPGTLSAADLPAGVLGFTGEAFRDFPADLDAAGPSTPATSKWSRSASPTSSTVWLWRPTASEGWDEAVGVETMVYPEDLGLAIAPGTRTSPEGVTSAGRFNAQDGVAITALSRGWEPDELEGFLDTVEVDDGGDLVAVAPPDGWELVVDGQRIDRALNGFDLQRTAHSALLTAEVDPAVSGGPTTDVGSDPQLLVIAAAASPALIDVQRFLTGGEQREVEVDGVTGWLLHRRGEERQGIDADGNRVTSVADPVPQIWWARDGVVVLVEAVGFTDDGALAVARSLRAVDEEEWAVLRARADAASSGDTTSCTVLPDGSQECTSTATFEGQGTPIDPGPTTTGDPTGTTTG